jgi:hypothetical protein
MEAKQLKGFGARELQIAIIEAIGAPGMTRRGVFPACPEDLLCHQV